jgi:hypothetical protein
LGKGDYLGGSTVVGPKSGWFSFRQPKKDKDEKREARPPISAEEFEAKQKRLDNFFAMLQRTTKFSTSSRKSGKRRRKSKK